MEEKRKSTEITAVSSTGAEEGEERKTQVSVIGLQVTLGRVSLEKKRRTTRFLDRRRDWTADFSDEQVDVCYSLVYVVDSGSDVAGCRENYRHNDRLTVTVSYVSLAVVSPLLADAVASGSDRAG